MVVRDLPFFRRIQSPRWLAGFLMGTLLCAGVFVVNVVLTDISPGSWWGIVYGTLASVLMVGDVLYAAKRRMLKHNLGKSADWVQFHIYGGLLFAILVLMHTGFRLPVGLMNWLLWVLSLWVTVSGLAGVFLQRWIPTILSSGLSTEVVYDRIPELVEQIRMRADSTIAECTDTLKDFYRMNLAGTLAIPLPRAIYYVDVTGGIQTKLREFEYLRPLLPESERGKLETLESLYRTKLELDAHYTLQRPLRWWLITHVPLSLVLVLLVVLHLYAVLVY
jgi:hypothetical protein